METIRRIMRKNPTGVDLSINFIALNKNGDFGAAGTGQGFEFAATGTSNSIGGYIDDVRLTAAAEPLTLSLLAIGLCGVAARRFRA